MPFVKGAPKPPNSGRKKGSINKLTLAASVRLAELGCDPLAGMAKIAADKSAPIELRARMYAELAQYVQPKRRSVEFSGIGGSAIEINISGRESLRTRIAGIASRLGERDRQANRGGSKPDPLRLAT